MSMKNEALVVLTRSSMGVVSKPPHDARSSSGTDSSLPTDESEASSAADTQPRRMTRRRSAEDVTAAATMRESFRNSRADDSHSGEEMDTLEESSGVAASTAMAASSSSEEDEESLVQPLHEQLAKMEEIELESALRLQRNRRILYARLESAVPRGRLALINLTRRNLGLDDARLLTFAIRANPLLSVLKLSYNSLGDEGAAIIAQSLCENGQHHANLSVLDLGFNEIGDAGCEALAVGAVAGNYTLRSLYLSANRITEKGALAIARAILHGTGLTALYLSANTIGPMGVKAIAGAVAKNDTEMVNGGRPVGDASGRRQMTELHLSSTGVDSTGFIAIPGMLLSNNSIRSLCLTNNNIDDNDMMLLSQALSQNKNVPLEILRLSFNNITCQGVECLMNSVWGSETLREIKLDNNKIKDRGAQLCAVVLTSIALENLDISFNRVTTLGIKALMKNLSENNSVQRLGLCGIVIDQNASKAVSYALAYNTSLRALLVDNCSTGYNSQRHIVAGIVSNRRSNLRVLTGFPIGPVARTLGMPNLPDKWSNDQVLGFFRLMWQQWLLKSARGGAEVDSVAFKGPAPPAAVAAAAKIALTALGTNPDTLCQTEEYEKPLSDGAPVDPGGSSLLERTDSGTMRCPSFADQTPLIDLDDLVDTEHKGGDASAGATNVSTVRGALENPERRNRNLQWLRLHFRSLNEVGRLPFNNADLWQLHQYYFSPPFNPNADAEKTGAESDMEPDEQPSECALAPPPTPALGAKTTCLGRAVSFQTLGDAFAASGMMPASQSNHKRRSDAGMDEKDGPASKRAKSLSKPRIAYYPRVMAKIQSLGTKPMEQSLSLLRQLKYTENIMFSGRDPYAEPANASPQDTTHSDVEMILLDLL